MFRTICALFILVTALLPRLGVAQVPQVIGYQGRVTVEGVNFDGSGAFRFALVNETGATTYWSNDGTSTAGSAPTAAVTLPVVKGLYSVLLGDAALTNMTAISSAVFQHPDVRLRVWFDDGAHGAQMLTPDQRIVAVAYAVVAGSVADGAITAAKIAPGAIGTQQLANDAVQATNVASGQIVKSVNGLTDAVTLTAGPNVTLTPSGSTLTIAATNPLATWTGSANVTTLGTVTTGVWQATPLADAVISSAAAWNGKQAGNATLTLLNGKSLSGSGAIALATQPTLDTPLLLNPVVNGPTGNFTIGNGYWWSTAVAYLRPTADGGLPFDIMPKGTAGGDCWIDICSTDVVSDPSNFETLNLTKRLNGSAYIGASAAGSGQVRNLMMQTQGGNVGVGKPFAASTGFAPLGILHLASDGSTDLTISSTGTGNFAGVRAYYSRGTSLSPSTTQSGDSMLFVGTRGFGATTYPAVSDSGIIFRASENFTNVAHGTQLSLQTTTPGTSTRAERMVVDVDVTVSTGNVAFATAGKGLQYKSGANARAGNATLVGGTVTVANTSVTANTIVMMTRKTSAGTVGDLSYIVTAGGGFTINSASGTDASVVSYQLIETN